MKITPGCTIAKRLVFALVFVAGGMAGHSSAAITDEGDYCWNVKITEDQTGPVTIPPMMVKLHVVPLGDGTTLSMTGRINPSGDSPFFLMGLATASPTNIIANLSTTQSHTNSSWRDTGAMRVTLNTTTLAGYFYELGHDFDKTNRVFDQSRYTAGTLTPRSCP